ncbi:Microtubule-associated protein RP/EB member 2 [Homalodisca vitripennis]|nr:Microtubule-associated protein RP/EB member 2 [Homalodisca vitripennis]
MMEMNVTVEGLEKERDFYFGKLRAIEVLCQEQEGENTVLTKILDILYATEDPAETSSELNGNITHTIHEPGGRLPTAVNNFGHWVSR